MSRIKRYLINNIKNLPGKTTNRKIVVIEADDYGGIRMPSKEVYNKMLADGLPLDTGRFKKYDTLACKEDLELLFEILLSVKDKANNPAVMTSVCSVANPDFEKIKYADFQEYFYEPFTKTLERYYPNENTFDTWQKGMNEGIFIPESHGREHLTVQLWMKKLREGNKNLRKAFDYGFTALDINDIPKAASQFRPEFYFEDVEELEFLKNSIKTGIELFEEIFNYKPVIFVPGNSIFHPALEKTVFEAGVIFLNVNHFMNQPDGKDGLKKKLCINGSKSKSGITYYARNCVFEPSASNYQGVEYTLRQIEAAFRWKKPAIISSHRVNFVGGLDVNNRDTGLRELKKLLAAVVNKWSDVEFMSSREMFRVIYPRIFANQQPIPTKKISVN